MQDNLEFDAPSVDRGRSQKDPASTRNQNLNPNV